MKNKRIVPLLVSVLLLAVCAVAYAEDIIKLTNGRELRGKILEETEDYIKLEGKHGVVQEISRSDIESVRHGFDFDTEYRRKTSGIGPKDSTAWYELGVWCEENKQQEKARGCFLKAIEADSENLAAREKLGHRKFQGKWYESEEEYYNARGWVSYGGDWMPKDDRDKYMAGLVKRDDGTWVSKKIWDKEEKHRRAEKLKKEEKELERYSLGLSV